MEKIQKNENKYRVNLYLDETLYHKIKEEAEKLSLPEATFARMKLAEIFNNGKDNA